MKFDEWGKGSPTERRIARIKAEYLDGLQACPKAGNGVHGWILKQTDKAVNAAIPCQEAHEQILHAMRECGRPEQANEICNAYDGAEAAKKNGGFDRTESQPKWHPFDPEKSKQLLADWTREVKRAEKHVHTTVQEFKCESPVLPYERESGGTRKILKILFPEADPLICAGVSQYKFDTRPLSKFSDFKDYQFVVPSPMSKLKGIKASAKNKPAEELTNEDYSAHTKDNTGMREYLIIESDTGESLDHQAQVIGYLRKFLPLAAIVHSGNKSLHAWFAVRNAEPEFVENFFNLACCLGADPKMWERQQFTRMPEVLRRDTDTIQEVIYLARVISHYTCPYTTEIDYEMPRLED